MIWERWSRPELKAEKWESAAATVNILPALKGNCQHPSRSPSLIWKQLANRKRRVKYAIPILFVPEPESGWAVTYAFNESALRSQAARGGSRLLTAEVLP